MPAWSSRSRTSTRGSIIAGTYLDSTEEALDIVDEVGRPGLRLLYDLYHSVTMGEDPATVLRGRMDRVRHVQVADVPGRHEPGSGMIDWRATLDRLRSDGYRGWLGLEYAPSGRQRGQPRLRPIPRQHVMPPIASERVSSRSARL